MREKGKDAIRIMSMIICSGFVKNLCTCSDGFGKEKAQVHTQSYPVPKIGLQFEGCLRKYQ